MTRRGPDGFPYRNLDLTPGRGGVPTTLRESLGAILDAGEGATIFGADSGAPEWVFTFGDLLAFDLYGNFDGAPEDEPTAETNRQVTLRAGTQMMIGSPAESYFPERARRALGAYLHRRVAAGSAWGPAVALVVHPELRPQRNLMINIGLEELRGDQAALDTEMRFIRWFLPRRHGLLSRGPGMEDSAFQPL
ncbi:hypothetical protein [Muricoccus radiodurans]|uniref:hypothetical protein n=1 Tax=Muricoccus radiodurans TaxID=2231721 RepID=UPI003CECED73